MYKRFLTLNILSFIITSTFFIFIYIYNYKIVTILEFTENQDLRKFSKIKDLLTDSLCRLSNITLIFDFFYLCLFLFFNNKTLILSSQTLETLPLWSWLHLWTSYKGSLRDSKALIYYCFYYKRLQQILYAKKYAVGRLLWSYQIKKGQYWNFYNFWLNFVFFREKKILWV